MRSFQDYMFIPAQYEGWIGSGYVSTIVCAASPSEAIQALQADDSERVTASGVKDLVFAEWDLDAARKTDGLNTQLVGVIDLGGNNVLLVQQNSQYVAATGTYLEPLFRGRDIVSHSSLGSGERFVWWSNGQIVADFDPYHYDLEEAVAPKSVIDAARTIGGVGIDGPPPRNKGFPAVAGSFALADHLTQSRVSREVLATGIFGVVVVRTGPALPPAQPRTFESESSWAAVVDRYQKSYRLSRHGRASETTEGQVAEVRFWYRSLRSYLLEDEYGVRFVSDYRQNIWSRVDGVLVKDAPPMGLRVHPDSLVDLQKNWDVELSTLLAEETEGVAVEVGGRPAWQFDLPSGWQGLPSSVAFDSETGIALRRHTTFQTIEFIDLEVGTELPDELFTGE